jgi:hypothetical protein
MIRLFLSGLILGISTLYVMFLPESVEEFPENSPEVEIVLEKDSELLPLPLPEPPERDVALVKENVEEPKGEETVVVQKDPVPIRNNLRCGTVKTYSFGVVDARFNLSKEALREHVVAAEKIWEQQAGELFSYRESGGDIEIRLVYDERQAATDHLRAMGIAIEKRRDSYDALQAQYEALARSVEILRAEHESRIAGYRSRETAYNEAVRSWNARGGAPESVFETLEKERAALASMFAALKDTEERFNESVATLNALATAINQLIVQFNLSVDQYNAEGVARGAYEAGVYEERRGARSIVLYEYSDEREFVRLVAHEFGHALGIEHVADREAIMHEINLGKSLYLTEDDIHALEKACAV